jgi:hypothetical protein
MADQDKSQNQEIQRITKIEEPEMQKRRSHGGSNDDDNDNKDDDE